MPVTTDPVLDPALALVQRTLSREGDTCAGATGAGGRVDSGSGVDGCDEGRNCCDSAD